MTPWLKAHQAAVEEAAGVDEVVPAPVQDAPVHALVQVAVDDSMHCPVALPSPELLALQARWLASARSRLLRESAIAHRQCVLDLGAGYGAVTPELVRRAGGMVTALDLDFAALAHPHGSFQGSLRICGDACYLPFATHSLDLVLSQCTLLWIPTLKTAVAEVARVLQPGGVFLALEPDYDGLMETPPKISTRRLWVDALRRAGANPTVGRELPGLLATVGFDVRVKLLETLHPPSEERFAFLEDLPLTREESAHLEAIQSASRTLRGPWAQIAHLPFFLITATQKSAPQNRCTQLNSA